MRPPGKMCQYMFVGSEIAEDRSWSIGTDCILSRTLSRSGCFLALLELPLPMRKQPHYIKTLRQERKNMKLTSPHGRPQRNRIPYRITRQQTHRVPHLESMFLDQCRAQLDSFVFDFCVTEPFFGDCIFVVAGFGGGVD